MSTDKLNVVIVGGGIVGCSIAYYLAREGARVTLLEKGPVCSEASSAAAGLASVSAREGPLLTLAQESLRLLAEASQQLEMDFELVRRGSLTLLTSDDELSRMSALAERQRARGVDVQIVDRDAALEMEPRANPDIIGAAYSPIDCTINPYATTLAFSRGARRLGATIRTGVEVTALKVEGGRVRAAVTGDGEVAGDLVVVAAGAWTPALTRTIGLDLPIEPSRGQIVVTEPLPPFSKMVIRDPGHIYVTPTRRGNYVIGSMTERVGFNKRLTPERLSEYVGTAADLVPSLKDVRFIRAWAGLRPLTPDSNPLLGRVEGYDGLILAAGHSRTGILMSGATSKMVVDQIMTGTTSIPLEPFSPTRFTGAA